MSDRFLDAESEVVSVGWVADGEKGVGPVGLLQQAPRDLDSNKAEECVKGRSV